MPNTHKYIHHCVLDDVISDPNTKIPKLQAHANTSLKNLIFGTIGLLFPLKISKMLRQRIHFDCRRLYIGYYIVT